MKRYLLVLVAGVLAVSGCRKEQVAGGESKSPKTEVGDHGRGTPSKALSQSQTYKLTIQFTGLIGYVQDQKQTVWALLMKADTVDPNNADTVPPGILDDINNQGNLTTDFLPSVLPTHSAWIRFKNAKITQGQVVDLVKDPKGRVIYTGKRIAGDISFTVPGAAGPPVADLASLSASGHIISALMKKQPPLVPAAIAALDEIDSAFVDPNKPLESHLVARARIDAGNVTAINDPCGIGITYSYNSGLDEDCPKDGQHNIPVNLAEEVDVTQNVPSGEAVTITIGNDSLVVEPKDPQGELVIQVMNDTDNAVTATKCPPPAMNHPPHPLAFRWFYRLADVSIQKDTTRHFYPCALSGTFLPPLCAGKGFVLKPKDRK